MESITNEDLSENEVEEKQEEGLDEINEEEKDNREIFDNNDAQNLDAEEIVKMKKEGFSINIDSNFFFFFLFRSQC